MTDAEPRFTDYGDDGDEAGAHRDRRSFRLIVVSVALLTLFAWFAETRLRYPLQEEHFQSAITLPRESARVFLLAAIRLEESQTDTPTPKYAQALAVRQEDDIALETFARAYELDPKNSFFALRYGSRLFVLNRAQEAIEIFRAARALPPANTLARYLEAAAIAKAGRGTESLGEAMVVVSRANNTRDPLLYPKPLWFSGYPQTGMQYAQLSREIYADVSAPLYALTQQVVLAAQRPDSIAQGQDERTWLLQIEAMGRRLVVDSDPKGSLQAIAGISIQMQAVQALSELLQREGEGDSAEAQAFAQRLDVLRGALNVLNEFEASRDDRIERNREEYWLPLMLILYTLGILTTVYLCARVLHAILRYRKSAWTVPHSSFGKGMLGASAVATLAMLGAMTLLQHVDGGQQWSLGAMQTLWATVFAILIGFGFIYPLIRVPTPAEVSGKSGRLEDMPDVVRYARAAHRRVSVALAVRYFGILTGVFICTVCVWFLLYRVTNGLFPWRTNLLASGLTGTELETVRQAIQLIGPR